MTKNINNQQGFFEYVFGVVVALIVLMFVAAGIFVAIYPSVHHQQLTLTVKRLEIMPIQNDHQYMVYTDKGVFKDVDSVLNGKWNSSDVFSSLSEGHTYSCDVTGFRITYLSEYQNIISCSELHQ